MKPSVQDQWKRTKADPGPKPPFRRLRGYAFDPSLSTQMETAVVNEAVFKVMWEGPEDLLKGPVGEYLEVIDYDPASGCFYAPIDLNSPLVLAQDGLAPSEGSPQFHQQMVYAVAMTTIRNFERALGRVALWAPDRKAEPADPEGRGYVQRLRIYPHALREANAYYSRAKIALLFGYFPASASHAGGHFPGGMVFTCLSHDIIAHETTHALLDGMHRRFIEPTHPDVLAFHEAFADIVALFQHFSFPEVLRHQIAKTRGDLASQNMLGQLAQQFGKAIGHYGALRDAIGEMDERTGEWKPKVPDPEEYQTLLEPHDRGAILVAAVFDAFISIYEKRVADLFRIATGGTGVLQEGALHPDLVNRLAVEAAKSAQHVLNMCIRALDYCPPVDITFGDYLRAMITADSDLVPDDDRGYRIAVIEAFRRRGIYPRDVRTLSVDSLRWQQIRDAAEEEDLQFIAGKLRGLLQEMKDYAETRRDTFLQRSAPGGRKAKSAGDGGCARVRMYRQGLGDCFLLSFPGEAQPVHMLIDCGVILGTQNPKPITQKVVADIKDATGGRLDVLVATHEHWVHLSGFIQAREIFDDMTIDEIWFAWTEDPGNDLAQQLKKERADRLNSLHVALERWQASGLQPRGAFGVASLLGFFGEPLAAANDNNTGAALKYLTTRKDAKIRYFEPGQSLTVKGASGARLYVLGPPQDARLIRKSSPTKTGREVYEETGLSIAVEAGFFAALRLGAAEGPGTDDRLSYPFDPYYHVTPSQAEQHGDLKKYYSSDASWRRIPSRCAGGELGVLADAAVAGERQ